MSSHMVPWTFDQGGVSRGVLGVACCLPAVARDPYLSAHLSRLLPLLGAFLLPLPFRARDPLPPAVGCAFGCTCIWLHLPLVAPASAWG